MGGMVRLLATLAGLGLKSKPGKKASAKVAKAAKDFVKRRTQLAGAGKTKKSTIKKASDFIHRRNKLKGVHGGKAAVALGAGSAGAGLHARHHIKKLRGKKNGR